MQYKHISRPIFKFGQPDVKWIEIDDSIIEPYDTGRETRRSLVFIDTEWGERNTPIQVNSKAEYVNQFGYVPDVELSQKGNDYLPQYLQYQLQGKVPMYIVRVQYPHINEDTQLPYDSDYYKQTCQYDYTPFLFLIYEYEPSVQITVFNQDESIQYVANTDYQVVQNGVKILNYNLIVPNQIIKIKYVRKDKGTDRVESYLVPNPFETIVMKQKSPGLFGQDFSQRFSYDSIYKSWSQEIGLITEFVQQSQQNNSTFKEFELYVQETFTDLLYEINLKSIWVNIQYLQQNPQTFYLQLTDQIQSGTSVIVRSQNNLITYIEGLDYYVDRVEKRVHIILRDGGIYFGIDSLSIEYINNYSQTISQTMNMPVLSPITTITELYSNIYRLSTINKLRHEISMQCPVCIGLPDVNSRYILQDYRKYYDQVQEYIIVSPNTPNHTYNQQKTMSVDFEKIIDDLVITHKIDNEEEFQIQFVPTLGLNKHSFFTTE